MTNEQFLAEVISVIDTEYSKPVQSRSDISVVGSYRGMKVAFTFDDLDGYWDVELLKLEPRRLFKAQGKTAKEACHNLKVDF